MHAESESQGSSKLSVYNSMEWLVKHAQVEVLGGAKPNFMTPSQ